LLVHITPAMCPASRKTGELGMPIFKAVAVHGAWEDWLLLAIGIVICLSPSLADRGYDNLVSVSAVIAGLIIILAPKLEIVALSRWHEINQSNL
jgi:hypothetical protein